MGAPLEFKRRVRLPEFTGEETAPKRRSFAGPLGALSWFTLVGLAVAIAEGLVPIERWLHSDRGVAQAELAAPRDPASISAAQAAAPVRPFDAVRGAPPNEPVLETEPRAIFDPDEIEEPAPGLAAPAPAISEPRAEPETRPEPALAELAEPREPEAPPVERSVEKPPAAPEVAGSASAGTSCEAAAASASQSIEMGKSAGPDDLTREDYEAVLNRGSYFAHCGVPDHVRVDVCAAVQRGRAVGVTVTLTPASPSAAACVARAVRSLGFPSHPRLDVVRTRFD